MYFIYVSLGCYFNLFKVVYNSIYSILGLKEGCLLCMVRGWGGLFNV